MCHRTMKEQRGILLTYTNLFLSAVFFISADYVYTRGPHNLRSDFSEWSVSCPGKREPIFTLLSVSHIHLNLFVATIATK